MTRHVEGVGGHPRDRKAVPIGEEAVELRTVALEFGSFIEDFAKGVRNDNDVLADPQFSPELALNIGRRRQMIGMDVGLDQPLEIPAIVPDMCRRSCLPRER